MGGGVSSLEVEVGGEGRERRSPRIVKPVNQICKGTHVAHSQAQYTEGVGGVLTTKLLD